MNEHCEYTTKKLMISFIVYLSLLPDISPFCRLSNLVISANDVENTVDIVSMPPYKINCNFENVTVLKILVKIW